MQHAFQRVTPTNEVDGHLYECSAYRKMSTLMSWGNKRPRHACAGAMRWANSTACEPIHMLINGSCADIPTRGPVQIKLHSGCVRIFAPRISWIMWGTMWDNVPIS